MKYLNEPLIKFTADLSAKLPAPGGGTAAALVGAVASSLNCMVGNFTVNNDKYKNVEAEVKSCLKASEELRDELLALMQADIDEYSSVSAAYKLPKETEEEKKKRTEAIQAVTKKAAGVPVKIMKACFSVMKLCSPMLEKGNKNLASDAGVAACFALAGLKAAYLNVRVNLASIKDEAFRNDTNNEIGRLVKEAEAIEREVLEACYKKF